MNHIKSEIVKQRTLPHKTTSTTGTASENYNPSFGNTYDSCGKLRKPIENHDKLSALGNENAQPEKRCQGGQTPTLNCRNKMYHFSSVEGRPQKAGEIRNITTNSVSPSVPEERSSREACVAKMNRLLSVTDLITIAERQSKMCSELFPLIKAKKSN